MFYSEYRSLIFISFASLLLFKVLSAIAEKNCTNEYKDIRWDNITVNRNLQHVARYLRFYLTAQHGRFPREILSSFCRGVKSIELGRICGKVAFKCYRPVPRYKEILSRHFFSFFFFLRATGISRMRHIQRAASHKSTLTRLATNFRPFLFCPNADTSFAFVIILKRGPPLLLHLPLSQFARSLRPLSRCSAHSTTNRKGEAKKRDSRRSSSDQWLATRQSLNLSVRCSLASRLSLPFFKYLSEKNEWKNKQHKRCFRLYLRLLLRICLNTDDV